MNTLFAFILTFVVFFVYFLTVDWVRVTALEQHEKIRSLMFWAGWIGATLLMSIVVVEIWNNVQ